MSTIVEVAECEVRPPQLRENISLLCRYRGTIHPLFPFGERRAALFHHVWPSQSTPVKQDKPA